jgi:aldehyde:ferredoxin oxidoreductase
MGQEWFGWRGKILKVDLSKGKLVKQDLPKALARNYIGCRGINARILYDEVQPETDAFGSDNTLVFGTGPLEGTPIGMGRMSVTTKSPRGSYAEGGFGGFCGPELKFAGWDHIVVKGVAEKPVYLWIDDDNAEIRNAKNMWGKTTWETDDIAKEEIGDQKIQVMSIGPAAENLVSACSVFCNRNHSGGRCGVGTVMGAKKLKAIAVRGSGGVQVAFPKKFEEAYMTFREILDFKTAMDYYTLIYGILGPPSQSKIFSQICLTHTYNAQKMQFQFIDNLSGEEYLEKYVVKPRACFCCFAPSCGKWYEVKEGPFAGTKGENLWAADITAFGALIGNDYFPAVLYMRNLSNQLGIDFMEAGYCVAWAMECYQRGIITKEEADGLDLTWGNYDAAIELIKKIAYRDGFGNLFAYGIDKAAEKIKKGSEKFALTVKGLSLESMPQRGFYTAALGVAVSEQGPDHTRWYPPYPPNPRIAPPEVLKELKVDIDLEKGFKNTLAEGKGKLVKFLEDRSAIVESLPSCVFAPRGRLSFDLHPWNDLLAAATGWDFSYEEMFVIAERIRAVERAFNIRCGFRRKDDRPPRRMLYEAVPECNYGPIGEENMKLMLDEYYEARGWDKKTSIPKKKKLQELGLEQIAEELERRGIQVR